LRKQVEVIDLEEMGFVTTIYISNRSYFSIRSDTPLDLGAIVIGVLLLGLYQNNLNGRQIYRDEGDIFIKYGE
jgi:hypothetical protein